MNPKHYLPSFRNEGGSPAKLMPIEDKPFDDQEFSSIDDKPEAIAQTQPLPAELDGKLEASDQLASKSDDPFADEFDTPVKEPLNSQQNEDSFEMEVKIDSKPKAETLPENDPFEEPFGDDKSSEPVNDQFEEPVKKETFDPFAEPVKETPLLKETPLPQEIPEEPLPQELPPEKVDTTPFPEPEQKTIPEPAIEKEQPFETEVPMSVPSQQFEETALPPVTEKPQPAKTTELPFDLDNNQPAQLQTQPSQSADVNKLYIVEEGDNYWKISKFVYGKGGYYRALARHNLRRIQNPRKLKPGMKVLVPTVDYLTKHYANDFPLGVLGTQTRTKTTAKPGFRLDASGQPTYIVGNGDTLGSIAQAHLGRASRWVQLYQMNRNTISNPKKLKIGTVLLLPADASRVRLVQRD